VLTWKDPALRLASQEAPQPQGWVSAQGFSLHAVDFDEYKKSEKEVQSWKTTATSSGSTRDLRLVLPTLAAASQQYIATNTGKKIKVKLYENDEQVLEIKGITNEKINQ
jgi:hypothetical protein